MLRLSELRLPLEHGSNDCRRRCCVVCGFHRIGCWSRVGQRSIDARRRRIQLIYSVDVAVRREAAVLRRHRGNPRIRTPDTRYRMVAKARRRFRQSSSDRWSWGRGRAVIRSLAAGTMVRPCCWRGQPVKQRARELRFLAWAAGVRSGIQCPIQEEVPAPFLTASCTAR